MGLVKGLLLVIFTSLFMVVCDAVMEDLRQRRT